MKRIIYLSIFFGVVIFSSCKETPPIEPDVNNITVNNDVKDSLNIAEQLAMLNKAGEFYNVNMKILDGTTPIEGAEVKLTSSLDGELIELIEVSDASGNIIFDEVTVGGNIIEIKKEGYYSALGLIDFKFERGYNYEVIDDVVAPITKNESAIIPLYNKGNGTNTAKIKGKVSIETDLTNSTTEVVKNQLLRADFSGNIVNVSEGISFSEYSLNVEGGLGEAFTNEEGEYEITIPTGNDGVSVNLLIPQLRLKQKLAYFPTDSEEPVLDSVMTTFGHNSMVTDIPFVRGVQVNVPEPEAAGRGFQISNITKAGRQMFGINGGYYSSYRIFSSNENQQRDEMEFLFTPGSGYETIPTVEVSDSTGEGAELIVLGEHAIQSVTLDSSAQYTANRWINFNIRAYYSTSYGSEHYNIFYDNIYTDANGEITQEKIDETLTFAFENRDWFGNNYGFYHGYQVDSIVATFYDSYNTEAKSKINISYDTRIGGLQIESNGENYTDPSISFKGGNPEEAANFEMIEFKTRWNFELDNSNNTSPYVAMPSIGFEYLEENEYMTSDRLVDENGDVKDLSQVTESDAGEVVFADGENYATFFYSVDAPVSFITEPTHSKAELFLDVLNGQIGDWNVSNLSTGRGYTEKFTVEVVPTFPEISGNGAEIQILGGSIKGDEYIWDGNYNIKNRGEGYVHNVNYAEERAFNISANLNNLFLRPQEEFIVEIDYGTGKR
ncbi:hypothetical protein QYS49_12715 [Marivirga salinae]|uniref:Uncharacterized protein n=1 Tax=Marivirga salinarum TaxID=3059078 RepID=A0AA49GDA0_9BACT|nr:hypothetical protein [Marivirga sp. BDSF4-3]WKK77858.2 hypothetical protein QYS49_12715 [Marivirga sp. BDSF4-3]